MARWHPNQHHLPSRPVGEERATRHLNRWARHAVALAAVWLLVMVAYPGWASSDAMGYDDLSRLNAPQRTLLAWFYHHGQWPLWNPFSFGGQPFLAAGQAGPLYLPNALFLFAPVALAMKLSYLFHELVAATGMYLFVWSIVNSRRGAAAGAIAFTASGFFIGHQVHTQMFDAMSWLPWIAWAARGLLLSPRALPESPDHGHPAPAGLRQSTGRRYAGVLAGTLALMVYAGHPQVTFYTFLYLALYLLLWAVETRRSVPWRRFGAVAGSAAFGLVLAAPQWLPTAALVTYSDRQHPAAGFLLEGSMPPSAWLQFLSPFAIGGGDTGVPISLSTLLPIDHSNLFWEFTGGIGIVALALALATIVTRFRTSSEVQRLTAIALVCAVFALGSYGFLNIVLTRVPGFNLFRVPARYIGLVDFALSALAGLGAARLDAPMRRWVAIWCTVFFAVLAAARLWGPLAHAPRAAFTHPAALCVAIVLFSLVLARRDRLYGWGMWGLAAVTSAGQATLLSPFVLVAKAPYQAPSGAIRYLQAHLPKDDPLARAAAFGETSISYDQAAAYQIPVLNGYDSLVPAWYDQSVALTWTDAVLKVEPASILDAYDVRYVVTPAGDEPVFGLPGAETSYTHWLPNVPKGAIGLQMHLEAPASAIDGRPLCSITLTAGTRTVTHWIYSYPTEDYYVTLPADWPQDEATRVTIRNEAWGGSFTIADLRWVEASGSEAPTVLPVHRTLGPRPWRAVYQDSRETVWENPDRTRPAWVTSDLAGVQPASGSVKPIRWTADEQEWRVDSETGGWLVLAQTYDPNWRASVDGQTAPVEAAGTGYGGVLTAVRVPKGSHDVRLVYRPLTFSLGLCVGGAALLAGGVWMLRGINRPRWRARAQG
ncbi:MAG: YfhO family protein [Alicyclobacillus macrosporangiidus]|uniref:YfhO family protein n=1 Tax=Alicyclobacillus macrosporangiidus TaxID=392015 RepID=UPI0026EC3BCB|nr:YfhO family protein [Alicyclobacillus macrosporangiidus]MCL6598286.1 YfhO family protein [Alicyclobacillus macrosporangiidus]